MEATQASHPAHLMNELHLDSHVPYCSWLHQAMQILAVGLAVGLAVWLAVGLAVGLCANMAMVKKEHSA